MKEYSPFTDPTFDADRLEKNEIRVGKQIYARLPKMPGRVFTRDSVPEGVTLTQELSENDIAFLADRYADEDTGETHDEVVVIGQDISFALDGMMLVGRHYHAYFDTDGNLIADPLQKRREGKNVTVVPGTTVTAREKNSEGAGKEKRKDGISSEQIRKAVDKIIAEADEMRREEKRSKLQRAEEEERKKLRKEMQDEDDELMTEEDKEAVAFVARLAEQIRREEEAKNGQAEEDGDEAEVGSDTLTDDSGTGYKCHIRPFFMGLILD